MFEIDIFPKKGFKDSRGEHVLSEILDIGIKCVKKVDYSSLYIIDGDINKSEVKTVAALLSDKITEGFKVTSVAQEKKSKNPINSIIEVLYKKGVTDTVSESVAKAIKDLGIIKDVKVKAGHKYYLHGTASQNVLNKIAVKLLANTLVQEYKIK
ncbi:MAG: phosphoribosylformylglycinamidine synthase subunit PurS [Endomicrobium sp.]|jgi:phosphoribosylformylglycinamidine synthase|nr:phosphoribosylformylglycinamidine synthase subunit PurS [Endomicrobium sp.]